jgi:membrane-associated phospholipid phosphatase
MTAVVALTHALLLWPRFDWSILEQFIRLRSPWLTTTMRFITWAGDGRVLVGLTVVLTLLLWKRFRLEAAYLVLVGASLAVMSPTLKWLFHRPRPDSALRLVEAGYYSFPSGHSLGSAGVYVAVAVMIAVIAPRYRVLGAVACVVVVTAVGLSRVYLRVHYPSDVIGGWALGVVWALGVAKVLGVGTSGERGVRTAAAPRAEPSGSGETVDSRESDSQGEIGAGRDHT